MPYEQWYKTKPSMARLRVFGSDAYVHIPQRLRNKSLPKVGREFLWATLRPTKDIESG